ncbi:MAG TPA: hypothetical protein VKO67_09685 [Smithellaceae bacterium]|nr:hypothetical protein [Smithellaceae bacterium]
MYLNEEITKNRISIVETPKELVEPVARILELGKEEAINRNWNFKSGASPIPNLPKSLSMYFIVWLLLNNVNDIIENINLVLNDLKIMRDDPALLDQDMFGDIVLRYKLLVRTYFYEFYRFKECYNSFLTYCRNLGACDAKQVKELRSLFYEMFKENIQVRREMVHYTYLWSGEKHGRLLMASFAESTGGLLLNNKTFYLIDKCGVLSELTDDAIKLFFYEGSRIRNFFSEAIECFSKSVDQIQKSEQEK